MTIGILGVHQTAPAFSNFSVVPKLGPLQRASGVVPCIRGFINITATPGALDIAVPCGSRASICAPRSSYDAWTPTAVLHLDDEPVSFVMREGHFCAKEPVGCGIAGAHRRLRVVG